MAVGDHIIVVGKVVAAADYHDALEQNGIVYLDGDFKYLRDTRGALLEKERLQKLQKSHRNWRLKPDGTMLAQEKHETEKTTDGITPNQESTEAANNSSMMQDYFEAVLTSSAKFAQENPEDTMLDEQEREGWSFRRPTGKPKDVMPHDRQR